MNKKIEYPITDIKAVDNKNIKYDIPNAITDVGSDRLKGVFTVLVKYKVNSKTKIKAVRGEAYFLNK